MRIQIHSLRHHSTAIWKLQLFVARAIILFYFVSPVTVTGGFTRLGIGIVDAATSIEIYRLPKYRLIIDESNGLDNLKSLLKRSLKREWQELPRTRGKAIEPILRFTFFSHGDENIDREKGNEATRSASLLCQFPVFPETLNENVELKLFIEQIDEFSSHRRE